MKKFKHLFSLVMITGILAGCSNTQTVTKEVICTIDGKDYTIEDMEEVIEPIKGDIANSFYEMKVIEKIAAEKGIKESDYVKLVEALVETYTVEPTEEQIEQFIEENAMTYFIYDIGIKTFSSVSDAEAYDTTKLSDEQLSSSFQLIENELMYQYAYNFKDNMNVGAVSELTTHNGSPAYMVIKDRKLGSYTNEEIAAQLINKLTNEEIMADISAMKEKTTFENKFEEVVEEKTEETTEDTTEDTIEETTEETK